ncbi:MAG: GAF domain-containing protein [Candidatus Omnitrophica bacterium]|nr:GAF domain-containing protein [Candidatus Omnitrophota bacterium]
MRLATLFGLGEELDELLPSGQLPRDTRVISRQVGISFAAVPLRTSTDRLLACVVAGPVILGRREDPEGFRTRIRALGLDPDPLWPSMLTTKLYSFAGLRSALQLLEDVGTLVLDLADEAGGPQPTKPDTQAMKEYTDRLLRSLLAAATTATDAEGGSVMVYHEAQQALRIAVAEGLGQEIISTTSLRRGEGLAGIASADRAILLLDDQTEDQRLRSRMTRKDVVSSLVAPLLADQAGGPLGVLSLRTCDPRRRFTRSHVEVLRRLLHLVGVALGGLRR